jgi:hypothetical protein
VKERGNFKCFHPFDPITEPSTDPAVVMDTHPATPIIAEAEHKIAKEQEA